MGTWGTGITSSDTFKDIYHDFYDLYNKEYELSYICTELENRYESVISDEDEANEFFIAMAKAKWECGVLDKELLNKIKEIIDSGSEIKRWTKLGATRSDLEKRENAINVFYSKLLEINEKPKRPKKIKLRDSIFKKGDCLSIDLQNGKYGASIVLTEQKNSRYGLNLLLGLDYYSTETPKPEDFKNGYCLILSKQPYLQYCYAKNYKKAKFKYDIIDNIKIQMQYEEENGRYFYGHWDSLSNFIIHKNTEGSKIQGKIRASMFFQK
jgi:hypothetical protein